VKKKAHRLGWERRDLEDSIDRFSKMLSLYFFAERALGNSRRADFLAEPVTTGAPAPARFCIKIRSRFLAYMHFFIHTDCEMRLPW
jgi:hypothetical protein